MSPSAASNKSNAFPLLPLRDVVVYPQIVQPLFVGRPKSIKALEVAMASDKQVLLVAQKNASEDEPGVKDLFQIGTVASILQLIRLPDGTVKVLVEGLDRARIRDIEFGVEYFKAETSVLNSDELEEKESALLVRSLLSQFEQYVQLSKKIPPEVVTSISSIDEPGRLIDTIASHMTLQLQEKQNLLELSGLQARIEHLMALIEAEIDLFQVEKRIRGRVKKQMEKSQREYYLNEQMKAIQKEMGELDDVPNEVEELGQKIADAGMPKEAKEKALSELNKLKLMSPMSSEASVVRTYLDWMVNVPWKKRSKVRLGLQKAEEILESDHYGLKDVKERILEYLAVQKRVKKLKGPILCLVGPPGVGKTSLGESIARATNRKYVRMALGGVRDEAEIRGHRRTYIGSLPGKILQKISKAGVKNPLFLLDEIDKMGMDNRGDPASALLEVLDPEQNSSFNDHYLEVDYDLSEVMFVCTSNSMNIPHPLLDRMEVIRIPGYTEDEKVNIAERYLVPKQTKTNGVADDELEIPESSIRDLIHYYTREAGVRGLEREIAKICRKVVKENSLTKTGEKIILDGDNLDSYSGVRKFDYGKAEEANKIGQVNGLAWTQVGGELLTIEAIAVKGKGKIINTGSLGDVMQESIQAAFTVVRSRANSLGLDTNFHEKFDLHIHVPEGATPKDGPSAGVGMCTALVSVLTQIPVRADVAMTGEITLRGQVLRIGGLKEKLLAAHRGNIKTIIIPEENERDLPEIPDNIKSDLEIVPVRWIDQVLEHALQSMPTPLAEDEKETQQKETAKEDIDNTVDENHINTH
ncbi:MAG: endopeptidase La [Gammaproteobacteria bacterium]|jgi:ATP-dependent Lon protease|nr:endopeptidase La [Gammaproteobacteria bacterium]|tara:strand:+ start:7175 stop:9604 length:2430 start_codon:yes stop_codon:yes gene_type:complete